MSEGPQPSGTTRPGTWAEERRFLSLGARGEVFAGRGGGLDLSGCWEGVVRHPETHPFCPLWGVD